jgi:flagellar hook capping protein FlgD
LARFLPALLVVALLGGSAAAFAVTERLKLERSPILGTSVDKVVSPTSDQPAEIAFRLRKADRVSVAIVDADGEVVRTLLSSERRGRGTQRFDWYGRDDAGVPVPDGTYRPRVHLAAAHRTILMPNPIVVDTTPPRIFRTGLNLRVFSPDGDYRRDYLRIKYRASEDVRPVLYANGHLVVLRKVFASRGAFDWNGRADGVPRPAGVYRLQVRGIDRAGNDGELTPVFKVRIRYIELAKHVIRARAGGRIVVRVSTDAGRYGWRIGPRHGRVRARRLVLAAGETGRYLLVVSERGHKDRAVVVVSP